MAQQPQSQPQLASTQNIQNQQHQQQPQIVITATTNHNINSISLNNNSNPQNVSDLSHINNPVISSTKVSSTTTPTKNPKTKPNILSAKKNKTSTSTAQSNNYQDVAQIANTTTTKNNNKLNDQQENNTALKNAMLSVCDTLSPLAKNMANSNNNKPKSKGKTVKTTAPTTTNEEAAASLETTSEVVAVEVIKKKRIYKRVTPTIRAMYDKNYATPTVAPVVPNLASVTAPVPVSVSASNDKVNSQTTTKQRYASNNKKRRASNLGGEQQQQSSGVVFSMPSSTGGAANDSMSEMEKLLFPGGQLGVGDPMKQEDGNEKDDSFSSNEFDFDLPYVNATSNQTGGATKKQEEEGKLRRDSIDDELDLWFNPTNKSTQAAGKQQINNNVTTPPQLQPQPKLQISSNTATTTTSSNYQTMNLRRSPRKSPRKAPSYQTKQIVGSISSFNNNNNHFNNNNNNNNSEDTKLINSDDELDLMFGSISEAEKKPLNTPILIEPIITRNTANTNTPSATTITNHNTPNHNKDINDLGGSGSGRFLRSRTNSLLKRMV